jgi:hypothetical protein
MVDDSQKTDWNQGNHAMKDSSKMSRRDWFRLRVAPSNPLLGHETSTANSNVLKPIEHPPNHDGLDLSELPPMRQAVLSIEQVNTLFSDIGGLATDIQLMQRAAHSARATAQIANTTEQLDFARQALVHGTIPRIQIRYRWQNSLWIDTLKREPDGFQLVRISHS